MSEASYRGTNVALDILPLAAHTRTAIATADDAESVYVLLAGDVEWNGVRARRADVFDAPASAVYVPPGGAIDIVVHGDSEVAAINTTGLELSKNGSATTVVGPDDVVVQERGQPGWQRQVHDVVADNVPGAQHLIVGETFNAAGQWSSFPPHKHDGADGEPELEEVYYFRFDRPGGFGFQGLYEADGTEDAVFLRHGSIVGIPRGYHPVCAAPGYRLYYLWALVGRHRQLAMYEDPAHRWLSDRPKVVGNWIHLESTEQFLELLSWHIGYEFDDSDWIAIENALPTTNDETEDGFYDYPLIGRIEVQVSLARSPGSGVVTVRVAGALDDDLVARIETLFLLL